eukprot:CCRYP_002809-RA/>CCRYP_002809-RA protein AED:0.29 eAED:1.00 QI:0/-1/0/1/-1/0/1/0/45
MKKVDESLVERMHGRMLIVPWRFDRLLVLERCILCRCKFVVRMNQ